jgi:hypothetical protein
MSFRENSILITIVAMLVAAAAYATVVIPLARGTAVDEIAYQPLMIVAVVVLVVVMVAGHVVAALAQPKAANAKPDEREKLIEWRGQTAGGYVLAVGGVRRAVPRDGRGALVLDRQHARGDVGARRGLRRHLEAHAVPSRSLRMAKPHVVTNAIGEHRAEVGMSQDELAALVGVSRSASRASSASPWRTSSSSTSSHVSASPSFPEPPQGRETT